MTTTGTYQGLGDDAKPSSRVLRPPGGGSSNIFGVEEQAQRKNYKPASSNIFGTDTSASDDQEKTGKRRGGPADNSRDNVFGGSTVENTREDNRRRGQDTDPRARSQRLVKTKGEEFPAYDRSVYAAQMTPQRRNITQVSTYNPITGQMYAGFEDVKDETPIKGKRPQQYSNGSKDPEGAFNPITGAPLVTSPPEGKEQDKKEEEENDTKGHGDGSTGLHTSSRVLAPPGGKSSGPLW